MSRKYGVFLKGGVGPSDRPRVVEVEFPECLIADLGEMFEDPDSRAAWAWAEAHDPYDPSDPERVSYGPTVFDFPCKQTATDGIWEEDEGGDAVFDLSQVEIQWRALLEDLKEEGSA